MQVRCAGCGKILTVEATEFSCDTCQLPQMLPPELMTRAPAHAPLPPHGPNKGTVPPPLPPHGAAHGVDPTKIQLPCANCKAILNVPHGLARFRCPQCQVDLAVDVSKLQQFFSPRLPLLPPPEEVNEVIVEHNCLVADKLRECGNESLKCVNVNAMSTNNTLLPW